MKKRTPFFMGLFVGIGISATYTVTNHPHEKNHAGPSLTPNNIHRSRVSYVQTQNTHKNQSHSPDTSSTHAELTKLYSGDQQKQLAQLDADDLKQLISYLFSRSDPLKGLDWKDSQLLNKSVLQLAATDLDAACEWLDSICPPTSRIKFYGEILVEHFKGKPLEAIAFAHQHLDENGVSETAGTLIFKTKNLTTEQAETLLSHVKFSNSYMGTVSDFSPDFDFLRFGETSLALAQSAPDHKSLHRFPNNFLEEWAKRDPEAAVDFYNSHLAEKNKASLPFNDIKSLIKGYLGVANDEEASSWLARILQPDNLSANDRDAVITELTSNRQFTPEMLQSTIEKMETPTEDILDFYVANTCGSGDKYEKARLDSLRLFPDPQSRINALESYYGAPKTNTYRSYSNFDELCKQLKMLNHSDAEIQRVQQAKLQGEQN